MAVYYKFTSAKDYDSIPIEGQFISVGSLKERIFELKHLGRGTDFDLMISNPQTNEEYEDESAMIPKNTSVWIRRVPGRPRKPIVAEPDEPKVIEDKVDELPPPSSAASSMLLGDSSAMKYMDYVEWDEFGSDLYAIPENVPTHPSNPVPEISPASKIDEESKIKALVETPALEWNRQGQDAYGGGRGFGRGMGGRMMGGRGFGRGGFERKTPPVGYICHRCKVPGHFIQHCPTNGDPNYDIRKVKPPTGIPKSMLMATSDGPYALPSGAVAVLKPNEAAFEKEIEGLPSVRQVSDLPPELRCPLCKEVMKDAVLTSKCCFRSFCDKCIRDYIITKSMCVCGATDVLADDLLPNKTLRETITRILESTTSSTENAGSLVQVQDLESARNVPPRVPSPTFSAASKDEPKRTPPVEYSSDVKVSHVKEGDAVSEGKGVNDVNHSLDKKTPKNTDPSEATPESVSAKEPVSPESTPVPEEVQEKLLGGEQAKKKKKKKMRMPINAADMQWRPYQDFGPEGYAGMPMAPAAYNPYWNGGMPMGMDGFMQPFGGAMPYMGYAPSPLDVPFGGMLPQDPFAAQGYMMPAFPPRDLSELGMGLNQGLMPPMSRGEFEAMKADIRRKREFERLNDRENVRDGRGMGREIGSSGTDGSSMKAKSVCLVIIFDPLTMLGIILLDWLTKFRFGRRKIYFLCGVGKSGFSLLFSLCFCPTFLLQFLCLLLGHGLFKGRADYVTLLSWGLENLISWWVPPSWIGIAFCEPWFIHIQCIFSTNVVGAALKCLFPRGPCCYAAEFVFGAIPILPPCSFSTKSETCWLTSFVAEANSKFANWVLCCCNKFALAVDTSLILW